MQSWRGKQAGDLQRKHGLHSLDYKKRRYLGGHPKDTSAKHFQLLGREPYQEIFQHRTVQLQEQQLLGQMVPIWNPSLGVLSLRQAYSDHSADLRTAWKTRGKMPKQPSPSIQQTAILSAPG